MLTCLFRKRLRRGHPPIPSLRLCELPPQGCLPVLMRPFSTSLLPTHNPVQAFVSSERVYDSVLDAFEHRALVGRCHFLPRRHHDISHSPTDNGIVDVDQTWHSSRERSDPDITTRHQHRGRR